MVTLGGDQVIGTLMSGVSTLMRSYYEDIFEDTVRRELSTNQEEGTRYQSSQHLGPELSASGTVRNICL